MKQHEVETYIKMCVKALPVQERKLNFTVGDRIYKGPKYLYDVFVVDKGFMLREEEVWLPSQDDLQQLLMMKYSQMEIIAFLWEEVSAGALSGTTFEQMWLEVFMKYKHNKLWDGEDWREVEHEGEGFSVLADKVG